MPSDSQADLLADEAAPAPDRAGLSQHERRQARLQERIAHLEAENIGEKDWFLKGEAGAGEGVHYTDVYPTPVATVSGACAGGFCGAASSGDGAVC